MNNFKQDGFGLIEVIIVATIGVIVFLSSASCLNSFLGITMLNIDKTEALFLTKSSLEQARALRDEDWTNISGLVSGNLYYFESDGGSPEKWIAQAGTKSENKYIIWVVVSEVQRDGNDDLVESGAIDVG